MANVIIGHSQVKYFENYLNIPDTKCDHFSGCLIEHLLQESSVKTLISKSQVTVVFFCFFFFLFYLLVIPKSQVTIHLIIIIYL